MYNKAIDMRDSTRIKLKMAENEVDNSSIFSPAYIRIYNKSLKENYSMYLVIEKKCLNVMRRYFSMDSKIVIFTQWVGRCAINACKKVDSFITETMERYRDE